MLIEENARQSSTHSDRALKWFQQNTKHSLNGYKWSSMSTFDVWMFSQPNRAQTGLNRLLLLSSFFSYKFHIRDNKYNVKSTWWRWSRQSYCWLLFLRRIFLFLSSFCLWFETCAKCFSLISQLVSLWIFHRPNGLSPLSIFWADLVSSWGNSLLVLLLQCF